MRKLLDQGTSVNAKRLEEGTTPLIAACNRAYYPCKGQVSVGSRSGCEFGKPQRVDAAHWEPLPEETRILSGCLSTGAADVKARHAYGWTALKLAGSKGYQGVVELLEKDVKK